MRTEGDRAASIRTFSKPSCIACGVPGQVLYSGLEDHLFSAPGVWQVKQCPQSGCGLLWLDPAPLADDLPLAYREYPTHTGEPGSPGGFGRRAGKLAYAAVVSIPGVLTGLSRQQRKFREMLVAGLPPGRLLDVGCGDGTFLHTMARLGWKGTGIDFDPAAVESGRKKYGLDLIAGDFQTAAFGTESFDAITMAHVIEHVPEPIACLDKCRRLLKPGGRLVATTPNVRSRGHRRFGKNWRGLEPPRHLHIFSPRSLAECARRAKLVVVRSGSTAVNADYFAKTSLAITKAVATQRGAALPSGPGSVLRAAAFQYREYFGLPLNSDIGEEAFLVATTAG